MAEEHAEYMEGFIEIENSAGAIWLDVDRAIENLDSHLRRAASAVPAEALECLCFEFHIGPVMLLFNSGRPELERTLADLRLLRDDPGSRIGSPAALARAAVELDPIAAIPFDNLFRSGAMGFLRESGSLRMFGDWPSCVPVRGVDKAEAERRLAWLLSQMAMIRPRPREAVEAAA